MIEKNYCICKCGHKHCVDKRVISLYKGMDVTLARIYKWCLEKDRHEFQRKEIKHLLISENDTARFGDWKLFGGLAYKGEKKGDWGLNMERCEKFFTGQSVIPTRILKDPITGELEKSDYKHVSEVPELYKYIDENGLYKTQYEKGGLFDKSKKDDNDIIDL